MVAKLGFIFLVLAFGMVMFLAGGVAPPALRAPLAPLFSHPATAPAQLAAPAAAATRPADAAVKQHPRYESLLLKSGAPDKGNFGVQLGLFPEPAAARPLAARAERLGYAPEAIDVADARGVAWTVLVAGHYPSAEEAETARAILARQLGGSLPLPLLLLPQSPAPSQTAP